MITITKIAAQKINTMLTARGKGQGIRLGVKTTGCNGLAYVLEYVDTPYETDQCVDAMGCKVFIDSKSTVYLEGIQMDYVRNGLSEGFEFTNPNSKGECGCGESFRV